MLRDAQVRNRKARQATSSLKQPMLQSAYSEPPSWTLTRLVRSAVITLISGIIAGQMRRSRLTLLMTLACEESWIQRQEHQRCHALILHMGMALLGEMSYHVAI